MNTMRQNIRLVGHSKFGSLVVNVSFNPSIVMMVYDGTCLSFFWISLGRLVKISSNKGRSSLSKF